MPPLSTFNKTALTLAVTQAITMSSANAAEIRIANFGDDGGNGCTLREAIESANNDAAPDGSGCAAGTGDDEIRFQNTDAVTINLSSALPLITSNMDIIGGGGGVTLNAAEDVRIFDISNIATPPTVSIENMTLTGATVVDSFGAGVIVSNGSNVTISNSTITGNTTNLLGGGVMVRANSTLTVLNSTISDNEVTVSDNSNGNRGGGIYVESGSKLLIRNSTLENNAAPYGGGIFNGGYVDIATDSTLSGNVAGSSGGGIYNNDDADAYIADSTLSGNVARSRGGGIFNYGGAAHIERSTLSGNDAGSRGGGIFNDQAVAYITDSTVSANSVPDFGGGIYARNSSVTLSNSTVSGNSASDDTMGYDNGGGIFAFNAIVTLSNSTVSGNSAFDFGGGIYGTNSTVTLSNSTVSTNSASNSGRGGGIYSFFGRITFSNSIIAGNQAGEEGEEFVLYSSVTASGNLFGSSATDNASAFEDFMPDSTNNIIATSDSSDSTELSSILAPLSNNGGPTQTHALVFGSPALNALNINLCLPTDQRGELRNIGLCDIGSFEAQANEAQPEESFFVVPLPGGKSVIFGL